MVVTSKFRWLIVLCWAGLIIDLASMSIGFSDVRQYYDAGRLGYLLDSGISWLVGLWLVLAVMYRKSWARKTDIALVILLAVLQSLDIGVEYLTSLVDAETHFSLVESVANLYYNDNMAVAVLDVTSMLISICCLYLYFCKDVAVVFLPDKMRGGREAMCNTLQCVAWWGVFILCGVCSVVYQQRHGETEQWKRDCVGAAVAGSSSAREEFIDKMVEETMKGRGISEDDAKYREEYALEKKMAEDFFDQQILEMWKNEMDAGEKIRQMRKLLMERDKKQVRRLEKQ